MIIIAFGCSDNNIKSVGNIFIFDSATDFNNVSFSGILRMLIFMHVLTSNKKFCKF